jgi:hypothetical protein
MAMEIEYHDFILLHLWLSTLELPFAGPHIYTPLFVLPIL